MHKLKLLILALAGVALFSCEPTYEKEYNWAYPVSGDWTVKVSIGGQEIYGPIEVKTYNSSFGQDSIWIDDYPVTEFNKEDSTYTTKGNFWGMKVKAAVNMKTKTFESAEFTNGMEHYPIHIKIMNGKVINKDSIYFEVQYEDDYRYDDKGNVILDDNGLPKYKFENTYQISGHRTSSYEEYRQQ